MKIIKAKKHYIVKKSEAITRARYKLNPVALKFITTIITNLENDPNKEYIYKVKDFAKLLNMSYSELYNELEQAVDELLKKPLHINTPDGWIKANWISDAEYKKNEGYVTFTISAKLLPYLLEIKKKFLAYKLENILKLRSTYVIRFYEILKDWLNKHKRYNNSNVVEKIVYISWIRKVLEIPNSYQYSSHIKKNILEKAQKQLAEHTDITFDFIEFKTGRKITHIKITIRENRKNKYEFMKSRKAFIEYLRNNYVNKPIIESKSITNGKINKWSINPTGLIYDMFMNEKNIDAKRSYEIFNNLYNFAKSNKEFKDKLANKI